VKKVFITRRRKMTNHSELFNEALSELDTEFPGADFDDSMLEFIAKRKRGTKLRKLIIKRCTPLLVVLIFGVILCITMLKGQFLSFLLYPLLLLCGLGCIKDKK
jgi:hypothetical protein